MSSRNILVTGGAGFLGGHLTESLVKKGHKVVVLDSLTETDLQNGSPLKLHTLSELVDAAVAAASESSNDIAVRHLCALNPTTNELCDLCMRAQSIVPSLSSCSSTQVDASAQLEFVHLDMITPDGMKVMEEIFKRRSFDVLVHLAGLGGVRTSVVDPVSFVDANVKATVSLLQLAATYKIQKLIIGSSSSVYGLSSEVPFSEDQRCDRQISPYAASKRAVELFSHSFHHLYKMDICLCRFFTVYGPRGRPDMAAFKFIDAMSSGRAIQQYGDGSAKRSYTYIGDVVQVLLRLLEVKDLGYQICNIGGSDTYTLSELIGTVERALGKEAKIERVANQAGDVPLTSADTHCVAKLVGYVPSTPLMEGMEMTVAWYRKYKQWVEEQKNL